VRGLCISVPLSDKARKLIFYFKILNLLYYIIASVLGTKNGPLIFALYPVRISTKYYQSQNSYIYGDTFYEQVATLTSIKLPSRFEVEVLREKLKSERFSNSDDPPAEQKIRLSDPKTGQTWGFVVVDNTRRGLGLGGIRMAPNITLREISRLAKAMTLKNSAACLPFGGGKSGLSVNPLYFQTRPGLKRDLIGLFAEALFIIKTYIPAPDMGTDETDIQQIYELFSTKLGTVKHQRGGAGRPPEKGGIPIDAWGLTAHGLFAAAKTMEQQAGGFPIKNARVVVQGYGNVGSWTATKLYQEGALIVGASDIHAALWNPKGLNVEQLNRIRNNPHGLQNYSDPVEKRFQNKQLDWLLEAPCDILVPAARPDSITAKNADRIQCRLILQGANAPINKMTEYYLENRRKIRSLADFIVNVGGVIGCAVELKMNTDPSYRHQVLTKEPRVYLEELIENTVSRNVTEVCRRLAEEPKDTIFREVALKLAEERLLSPGHEEWL
jgi:glutamate dehydrogenase (NAD(P)+)